MAWYDKWAVMVIAAAIGVAGYYGIPWCKMGVAEWAYWIAATGSVGAILMAIWLGTTETRRREAAEHSVARLTATTLHVPIMHMSAITNSVATKLEHFANGGTAPNGTALHFSFLTVIGENLKKVTFWDAAQLLPLTRLRGDCATKIAVAQGLIDAAARVLSGSDICNNNQDDLIKFAQTNMHLVKSAAALLIEVEVILKEQSLSVFDPDLV